MDLDAASQFSVGQLVAEAMGTMVLGVLLAGLLGVALHAALHAAGAWELRRGAARKFSWWLAVLGFGMCVVVGGWKGAWIGAARAVVVAAKEIGPKALQESVEQAMRSAGMTNFAQLDVTKLRELLDKAESAPLPPLDFPGADQVRPQIEEARAKLLPAARALLDAHAKEGKLALSEAVASLWPRVFNELVTWERHFRRWEIITGFLWVVGIEGALALVCLVVRLVRKPLPPSPPAIPNLESCQPKRN